MPVIVVLNRKGGSGKTTLATHLAGHCARQRIPVMLGDVDRQKSAQVWLKLRSSSNRPTSRIVSSALLRANTRLAQSRNFSPSSAQLSGFSGCPRATSHRPSITWPFLSLMRIRERT